MVPLSARNIDLSWIRLNSLVLQRAVHYPCLYTIWYTN